jgi:hypothetical protein
MGQASNSGRNASLDSKKVRAAGRQAKHDLQMTADFDAPVGRGQTKGAFGRPASPPPPSSNR